MSFIPNVDLMCSMPKYENVEKPEKTLRFCVKAGHLSILEFAQLVFRIECPIFVARQLMRYRNASYGEESWA